MATRTRSMYQLPGSPPQRLSHVPGPDELKEAGAERTSEVVARTLALRDQARQARIAVQGARPRSARPKWPTAESTLSKSPVIQTRSSRRSTSNAPGAPSKMRSVATVP
jgi:hypothetical protein